MSFIQRINNRLTKKMTIKVAWIGLDFSGKTTLIKRITQGKFDDESKRTLGLNVDIFNSENVKFLCWDIGGQPVFRDALWESYIAGSTGIIFVIDSADEHRFEEARIEIRKWVLDNKNIENIPILILANKQDLPEAHTAGFIARKLGLHKVTSNSFAILPCSALSGFNLDKSIGWLRQRIKDKINHPQSKFTQ